MNDDTLTLYYYNDGLTNAERQEVANALAIDPALADLYQSLCRELEQVADPEMPAPPSDMVQRWHDSLDRAIGLETRPKPEPAVHSWSFLLGAAVTAALAIGVGIGMFLADEEPATPMIEELTADNPISEHPGSSAFIRGLQVHLRESEQGLTSLDTGVDSDRSLLIMNIIEQNRLFERVAEQNDSENLARVLRAFQLVLMQLAAEDISDEDAEALRAKLLFELNVMLTKLANNPSDEPTTI
ncbi:MAG: hypothetical protein OEM63_09225 [Gammaproteobacteria bacterium]|nr:hypothetical protein [Gammaproteobacteria bacterium]